MSFSAGITTPSDFQWMSGAAGGVPPYAVLCGYDCGEPIYVGRAYYSGALLPGKVQSSHGCCYVPWGGEEHACRQYEVLCTRGHQANWQNSYGSQLPPGAVQGGRTENGEPLYIGRRMHNGCMVPGKVQASHSTLYIPYAGKEHSYRDYEVLVSGVGPYGIPPTGGMPPTGGGYPYPGYPNYPNPGYPGYPGNQPGTCPRW